MRIAILVTSVFWLATSTHAAGQPSAPLQVGAAPVKVAPEKVEPPKFSGFAVCAARCDASLRNVILPLSGEVELPSTCANATKLSYDIAINGVRQQSSTVPVLKRGSGTPYAHRERELTLPTSRADAQLRLYIDAAADGAVQTVTTPSRTEQSSTSGPLSTAKGCIPDKSGTGFLKPESEQRVPIR